MPFGRAPSNGRPLDEGHANESLQLTRPRDVQHRWHSSSPERRAESAAPACSGSEWCRLPGA